MAFARTSKEFKAILEHREELDAEQMNSLKCLVSTAKIEILGLLQQGKGDRVLLNSILE